MTHFTNTTDLYRQVENLRDLVAAIEDNGEIYPGELAMIRTRLAQKEKDLATQKATP